MYIVRANTADSALVRGLQLLVNVGHMETSRNGTVLSAHSPVAIQNREPSQRVSFLPERDANPFFHYLEAMWMLAGRNDVAFVKEYVGRMADFSDDTVTLHGAYGYRWRAWFGYDQIELACAELKSNPSTRRVVIGIWDASAQYSGFNDTSDLHTAIHGGADIPCNTQLMMRVRDGALDMTVVNRSNDAVWGAHGANIVHMSILLEYMAAYCGYRMGVMYQISNNYHVYERPDTARLVDFAERTLWVNEPVGYQYPATPLFTTATMQDFDTDLSVFFKAWDSGARTPEEFPSSIAHPAIHDIAIPMVAAYHWHKRRNYVVARAESMRIQGYDWRFACLAWLSRREEAQPNFQKLAV